MSDDIDGSGRIKHRLTSDTIYAALEGTLMILSLSTRITGCYTDVTSHHYKKQPRMPRRK